jgi:hypothetical protein
MSFDFHQICSCLLVLIAPERTKRQGSIQFSPATARRSSTAGRCDCPLGLPRDLIAFELYPFTPGENQKARFYPPSHAENTEKENTES